MMKASSEFLRPFDASDMLSRLAGLVEPAAKSPNRDVQAQPIQPTTASSTSWRKDSFPPDVLYTYYPFITVGDLSSLSPTVWWSLESHGCLHIPLKDLLDDFIEQYFLFVHPFLPMLDDTSFARIYYGQGGTCLYSTGISLLFIRAVLFATCHLVSQRTIKALGFDSVRECRAKFYHQARILYESNVESSHYWKSQAALLLTFWSPRIDSEGQRPNTCWLSAAICDATHLGAHNFESWPENDKHHALYKRLWWSCIIRDRALSLALRRDMQIGGEGDSRVNISNTALLTQIDLDDTSQGPLMCDQGTRSVLAGITASFIQLCVIMTDLLDMKLLGRRDTKTQEQWTDLSAQTQNLRTKLSDWYNNTTSSIPFDISHEVPPTNIAESGRASIVFHTYVMYMYYFSAVISLSNLEIFELTCAIPNEMPYTFLRQSYMRKSFDELESSIYKFSKCMQTIIQLDLARSLPISLVAFAARPLAFNILFARAQQELTHPCKAYGKEAAEKQNQLNTLIHAMKLFRDKYDGVEWVSAVIREAVNQAQLYELDEPYNADRFWGEALSSCPDVYVRLALTIDLSLQRGRELYPHELSTLLEYV